MPPPRGSQRKDTSSLTCAYPKGHRSTEYCAKQIQTHTLPRLSQASDRSPHASPLEPEEKTVVSLAWLSFLSHISFQLSSSWLTVIPELGEVNFLLSINNCLHPQFSTQHIAPA